MPMDDCNCEKVWRGWWWVLNAYYLYTASITKDKRDKRNKGLTNDIGSRFHFLMLSTMALS